MSDVSQVNSVLSLDPTTYLELYEIYVDPSVGFIRIHSGKNFNRNIIYKGEAYLCAAVEFSGIEVNSSGSLPRPTLTISNVNSIVTNYIKNKNDLTNVLITRIKVYLKNIDDENFPKRKNPFFGYKEKWNSKGYGPSFFSDKYYINTKKSENKYSVEFELSSPFDMENAKLPARKINDNLCPFIYRGLGCFYGKRKTNGGEVSDKPIADVYNNKFISYSKKYKITELKNSGIWNSETPYTTGDYVYMQSTFDYDFSKQSIQYSSDDLVADYYVCINEDFISGPNTNPKFDRKNWVKDECGKNITACKDRWQTESNTTLPFGGLPGTRPYEYRT
jgi:lambda family phage minor tail protein L